MSVIGALQFQRSGSMSAPSARTTALSSTSRPAERKTARQDGTVPSGRAGRRWRRNWPSARKRRRMHRRPSGAAPPQTGARRAEQRAEPAQPPEQQPRRTAAAASPADAQQPPATASRRRPAGAAAEPPNRRRPQNRSRPRAGPAPQPQPPQAAAAASRAAAGAKPPAASAPPARRRKPPSRRRPPPVRTPQAAPPAPPRAAAARTPPPAPAAGAVRAVLKRNGDNLSITFPFAAPTPAAVFRRADTVWMVFDTDAAVGISALNAEQGKTIRSAIVAARARRRAGARQARTAAAHQRGRRRTMAGWSRSATRWSSRRGRFRSAAISSRSARASVTVAIDEARSLHRIEDPDVGDVLYVITAAAPARGFLKSQDFVEFRALASAHGIALQPLADDLNAELVGRQGRRDRRPGGLSLSAVAKSATQALYQRHVLDLAVLGVRPPGRFHRAQDATRRSPPPMRRKPKRLPARCDLARFYLARDMYRRGEGGARRRGRRQSADRPRTPRRWCCARSPIS